MDLDNDLIRARHEKLQKIKDMGFNPYPYKYERNNTAAEIKEKYASIEKDEVVETDVSVAGRIMLIRSFGKAAFFDVKDFTGKIQVYIRKNEVSDETFALFKLLDIGDIVGVRGKVFRTRAGELSIYAKELVLLSKALYPLPEKWHGLKDKELRYRQRYLDLIMNDDSRKTFVLRSRIINFIREFLNQKGYYEVETPILQPIIGGAAARPFVTHHNALDIDLYLRIAPELYLKRLIVGGFERVYELGKNFRNEGMDLRHNPEFTMIELYQAYADYNDMMQLLEHLLSSMAKEIFGNYKINYLGNEIDLTPPFRRIKLRDAILEKTGIDIYEHRDLAALQQALKNKEIEFDESKNYAKLVEDIFERFVEDSLIDPTFVIDYPRVMSPLAKVHRDDPWLSERFEFFMGARELANAYSEQSDPEEQYEAFKQQVAERAAGDDEAMLMDEDYVVALRHGMPPTGGLGIGVDRLVMFFVNTESIRDVILFPQMKPKR